MEPASLEQLWQRIREEWQEVPVSFRPWGVWITYHTPLIVETDISVLPIETVRRTWFFESTGDKPREKSVSAFIRFWIMQKERSWDLTGRASPDPCFSMNYHAIGRASFACFVDSGDIYLEIMWAGLYGSGRRLTTDAEGYVQSVQTIWVA